MSDFEKRLHDVEINFPKQPGGPGEFWIKIDGVPFEPTCGVTIESAMVNNSVYPVVTLRFMARTVKGSVEGIVLGLADGGIAEDQEPLMTHRLPCVLRNPKD